MPAAQFGYVVKEDAKPKRSLNYQYCVRTSVPATTGPVDFNRGRYGAQRMQFNFPTRTHVVCLIAVPNRPIVIN